MTANNFRCAYWHSGAAVSLRSGTIYAFCNFLDMGW